MEYLVAELLELAGECTQARNKVRIMPRDMMFAIKNDSELDQVRTRSHRFEHLSSFLAYQLLKDVVLPSTGSRPFVHPNLLPVGTGDRKKK